MDDLIELFSIINIDGSFLLLFDQYYKNIRLVLFEFSKLIKYISKNKTKKRSKRKQ